MFLTFEAQLVLNLKTHKGDFFLICSLMHPLVPFRIQSTREQCIALAMVAAGLEGLVPEPTALSLAIPAPALNKEALAQTRKFGLGRESRP